jgi:membrane protein implicated in regulation of membrane protease activity
VIFAAEFKGDIGNMNIQRAFERRYLKHAKRISILNGIFLILSIILFSIAIFQVLTADAIFFNLILQAIIWLITTPLAIINFCRWLKAYQKAKNQLTEIQDYELDSRN